MTNETAIFYLVLAVLFIIGHIIYEITKSKRIKREWIDVRKYAYSLEQLNRDVKLFIYSYWMDDGYKSKIGMFRIHRVSAGIEDNKLIVEIDTERPGLIIGKGGQTFDELKKDLLSKFEADARIKEVEIRLKEIDIWKNMGDLPPYEDIELSNEDFFEELHKL